MGIQARFCAGARRGWLTPVHIGEAFRIEAWDDDLVIWRETKHRANIASLKKIPHGKGHVRLSLYLDQREGRCFVYSEKGKFLADLSVKVTDQPASPGLRLINKRGEVRLERFEVAEWGGPAPRGEAVLDKPRIHLSDGTLEYRGLASYDPATKTFVLRGTPPSRLPAERSKGPFWPT